MAAYSADSEYMIYMTDSGYKAYKIGDRTDTTFASGLNLFGNLAYLVNRSAINYCDLITEACVSSSLSVNAYNVAAVSDFYEYFGGKIYLARIS